MSERRILWTAGLCHGLIHVYELAVPALLLPIQAEFGVGDLKMGQVVTLYGLLFGVGALPAGWLVDRVGAKPLLLACIGGSSIAVLAMSAAPGLGTFSVAAGLMGLCLSVYHPAGTSLLTHAMRPSGRVFALHGMLGNAGIAASGVVVGGLGAWLGWRIGLAVLGLFGAGLAVLTSSLPTPAVHEIRARPGRGRWPEFVLLLVAIAFMGTVYRGVTTFLPKHFAAGLDGTGARALALAGLFTSLALVAGMCGMYVSGRLVDRATGAPGAFVIGAVAQLPFLLALGWAGGPAVLAAAMGVAFFHFFTQPAGNHMVAEYTPPRLRGVGYGVYFFVSFGAGSFGATLGGWISERSGSAALFPAMAVVLVPSIVAIAVLMSALRRPSSRTAERAARPDA